jgi:hypothetical protein
LITIHLASLDEKAQQGHHGKGAISSLRNKTTDPLFFEKIEIVLYGMYSEQVAESISRMDLESVMLVISTTLPCIFTILQIFHVKRRPEAAAATSITMLVVLALGYVAPLVVSSEALFLSRRILYKPFPFDSYVPYELSQAMMRAPTLISSCASSSSPGPHRRRRRTLSGRGLRRRRPTRGERSGCARRCT